MKRIIISIQMVITLVSSTSYQYNRKTSGLSKKPEVNYNRKGEKNPTFPAKECRDERQYMIFTPNTVLNPSRRRGKRALFWRVGCTRLVSSTT